MAPITVLSPVATHEPVAPIVLAPRTGDLEDAHLTLISNGKPKAREILQFIADELRTLISIGEIEVVVKPTAAFPITADEAQAVAERADLVIAGLGDCGACSACSLHDAVQVERLGVPAALVITDVFPRTVASFAPTLGADGYRTLVLPHPVSSRGDARLRRLARDIAPAARDQLTVPVGAPVLAV